MNVIGHTTIVRTLTNNLSNVTLLMGLGGIGKKRVALAVSSQLVKDYDRLVIDGDVGIDEVRSISKFVSIRPFNSAFKIVIIDCDNITEQACQALLRLLEDSSSKSKFILINSTGRLPLTILSRCTRVVMEPLSVSEVAQVLEQLGYAKSLAQKAAQFSQGSVSIALEYLEQQELRQQVVGTLNFVIDGRIETVIKQVHKWTDIEIGLVLQWFRDLLQLPFNHMFKFTVGELDAGKSLPASDVQKCIKFLERPMRPALKMLYLTVRLMEKLS